MIFLFVILFYVQVSLCYIYCTSVLLYTRLHLQGKVAPLGTHSVEHSNLRAVVKLKNIMKQDTSTEASITKGVCSVCLIHLHEHLSSR